MHAARAGLAAGSAGAAARMVGRPRAAAAALAAGPAVPAGGAEISPAAMAAAAADRGIGGDGGAAVKHKLAAGEVQAAACAAAADAA